MNLILCDMSMLSILSPIIAYYRLLSPITPGNFEAVTEHGIVIQKL
jgi:hypothetical protein